MSRCPRWTVSRPHVAFAPSSGPSRFSVFRCTREPRSCIVSSRPGPSASSSKAQTPSAWSITCCPCTRRRAALRSSGKSRARHFETLRSVVLPPIRLRPCREPLAQARASLLLIRGQVVLLRGIVLEVVQLVGAAPQIEDVFPATVANRQLELVLGDVEVGTRCAFRIEQAAALPVGRRRYSRQFRDGRRQVDLATDN